MEILAIVLASATLALCVIINVLILLQKKRASGLGGSFVGMGSATSTYFDKNKGRTLEGKLEFWTKLSGAAFMVLCLVLNVVH
jgi:preprotein translocase subunit SecG